MAVRSPSNVYAQQLYPLGYGYPLWDPEPPRPSDEVFVGDVGFLKDGAFYRAFNATKSRDHPANSEFGVPDGYEPFEYSKYSYVEKAGALVPGPRCSKAIKQLSVEMNASGLHGSAGVKFQCTDEQGAVLILQHSTDRQEILPSRTMALYMAQNIESWHDFITMELDVDIPKGSILFVNGVHKTPQWAVASYTEAGKHAQFHFNADLVAASTAFSVSASQESYTAPAQNWGPRSGIASTPDSLQATGRSNQSVFIHHYKLKRRLLLFPAIMKGAAGYDKLPPGSDGGADTGGISVGVDTLGGIEVDEIERDYTGFQVWDPVDFVLDYILKHATNAETAVANDHDIAGLCNKIGCGIPKHIKEFLEIVKPHVEVTRDGVGMLATSHEDLAGTFAKLGIPSTVHATASPPIAGLETSSTNCYVMYEKPASDNARGDRASEKTIRRLGLSDRQSQLVTSSVKDQDDKNRQTRDGIMIGMQRLPQEIINKEKQREQASRQQKAWQREEPLQAGTSQQREVARRSQQFVARHSWSGEEEEELWQGSNARYHSLEVRQRQWDDLPRSSVVEARRRKDVRIEPGYREPAQPRLVDSDARLWSETAQTRRGSVGRHNSDRPRISPLEEADIWDLTDDEVIHEDDMFMWEPSRSGDAWGLSSNTSPHTATFASIRRTFAPQAGHPRRSRSASADQRSTVSSSSHGTTSDFSSFAGLSSTYTQATSTTTSSTPTPAGGTSASGKPAYTSQRAFASAFALQERKRHQSMKQYLLTEESIQNSAGVGRGRGGVDGRSSRGGPPRSRKKPPPIVPARTRIQWLQAPVVSALDTLAIPFGRLQPPSQPSPPKEENEDTMVHWDGSAESSAAVDRDRKPKHAALSFGDDQRGFS